MGLVIGIKKNDVIKINDNIYIEIIRLSNSKLGIHIIAPKTVKITRGKKDE